MKDTFVVLEKIPEKYKADNYVKNIHGFTLKNKAMLLKAMKMEEQSKEMLFDARKIFENIIEEDSRNSSAWLGLGNVLAMTGEFEEGLKKIEKSLEIDPDNMAAIHDKEQIERFLNNVRLVTKVKS